MASVQRRGGACTCEAHVMLTAWGTDEERDKVQALRVWRLRLVLWAVCALRGWDAPASRSMWCVVARVYELLRVCCVCSAVPPFDTSRTIVDVVRRPIADIRKRNPGQTAGYRAPSANVDHEA